MRSTAAPLILVAARLRRRPGRFGLPVLGIALAAAFACAVAAESVIAGDRGARSVLTALDSSQRSVRVGWDGPAGPGVDRRARALLRGLGLPAPTRVVLLSPVRLDGVVVRPAAISPLAPWVSNRREHGRGRADRPGLSPGALGACRPRDCPVLAAGGVVHRRVLSAPGVTLRIVGTGTLRSVAPLGFAPSGGRGMPLLLTPDVTRLDSLPALTSLYRSQGWLAPLDVGRLQSWELEATEGRLQRAQAALATSNGGFSLDAPFAALDAARAEAAAAPSRLLAAGGGALAALAVFVILAAYGLRGDQASELERLRIAGARSGQRLTFALGEAAILSATGLVEERPSASGPGTPRPCGGPAGGRRPRPQPRHLAGRRRAGRRLADRDRRRGHGAGGPRRAPDRCAGPRGRGGRGSGADPGRGQRWGARAAAGTADMPRRRRARVPPGGDAPERRRAARPSRPTAASGWRSPGSRARPPPPRWRSPLSR